MSRLRRPQFVPPPPPSSKIPE
ncbi:hypothetical protein A2U01_0080586, partial [Trifolium medium]|nr:hypothetical protein [Trifolium medium]